MAHFHLYPPIMGKIWEAYHTSLLSSEEAFYPKYGVLPTTHEKAWVIFAYECQGLKLTMDLENMYCVRERKRVERKGEWEVA